MYFNKYYSKIMNSKIFIAIFFFPKKMPQNWLSQQKKIWGIIILCSALVLSCFQQIFRNLPPTLFIFSDFFLIIIKSQLNMQFDDSHPYFSDDDADHQIFDYYFYHSEDSESQISQKDSKIFSDSKFFSTNNPKEKQFPTFQTIFLTQNCKTQLNQSLMKSQFAENIISSGFDVQTIPSDKQSQNLNRFQQTSAKKYLPKKIIKRKNNTKSKITLNIQIQSQQSRQIKLQRYRQKKQKRNWERGILYEERKKLAYRRMRVQGRFQSKNELSLEMIQEKKSEESLPQQKKPQA